MSWTNNLTMSSWSGTGANKKTLSVENLNASSMYAYYGGITYVSSSVVKTGYVVLNDTIMTTINNILYVNGEAVFTPSSFSTISDWSYFPAKTDVIMSNFNINNANNVNASNVNASNVLTNCVNASTILASNIVTYKINPRYISSFNTSTNILYADNATIPILYADNATISSVVTSSFGFETALGKDIAVSSMLANRSIYIPDTDDSDSLIVYASRDVNELYGIITTSENRSSFSIGAGNNLTLVATSSIQMLGADGIDMRTNPDRLIRMTTTALGIDASGVVINADQFNTNAYMSTNVVQADIMLANIADFKVLNASTINFDTLNTNNILNSSNIDTATLDVSGNAYINNLTANGLTVNNSANYSTYISFGTSNSEFYGAQYLYDINSVRNLQVEKITVLGGWTGDDIIPPYYNDSIVEIGEDTLRPGQVTINGFNPDPLDTGTALTVRGDTQITQNLNVLGLTTLEGLVETIGDLNVDGAFTAQGTVDITGITTATGLVNCLGGLGVEGAANFLGAVTAEAGIGIVGALGLTGGNVTFGSSIDTGYNFNVCYYTTFNNNVDMTKHIINNVDVLYFTNISNDNQYFFQYATYTYPNTTSVETLKFNDCPFLYNSAVSVGQNSLLNIRDIQFVDQVNGGYKYISVFDNEVVLTLFDESNNYVRSSWVAETWSKFKALQALDIDNQDIHAVNQLNASTIVTSVIYTTTIGQPDPYVPIPINVNNGFDMGGNTISNVSKLYYGDTQQPFTQFGKISTGTSATVFTLPVPYASSNYSVQLTYGTIMSGGVPLYVVSQTASNFTYHGTASKLISWTTFGYV